MNAFFQQLEKEKLDEMRAVVITITGYMVLPLYLIFWVTDLVYVPEFKWEFLFLRCLVIPIALAANYYIKKAVTLLVAQQVALIYVFSLAAIINVMIFMMADPITPYYTGLILISIGGLAFFPWDKKYFIYVVLAIFFPYVCIVYYLEPNKSDLVYLIVIGFFINGMITVLWVVNFFRERLRVKEIISRLELKEEIIKRQAVENDLVEARDVALQASQEKSIFLANMSHELRTPLNAIIGYSELLQDAVDDDGNEKYIKDLSKIDSAGRNLLQLINGVLDISKIEAGQMELLIEELNIEKFIFDIKSTLQPLIATNNNEFKVDCPSNIGFMKSDETKLRQIIYNLGSNAGKFTNNGKVTLSVSEVVILSEEWIRFDMSDTGIGMSADQMSKVFKEFTQGDSSTTKKFGGTGLGLSICKRFCEMLKGDVFLTSKEGFGSIFTVLIPRDFEKIENEVDVSE